ncbi:hypothetical protein FB567DRAFT_542247 [Paraphoma chrysanthemicola]|uniref:F-box domain-containing protein n=1 Tax=Paraphoma chrysanthemicola TaxID=798071 RepID=A0A8K0QRG5_9PLEO|nr:hypothetical protein FB567DRAFT_542247 [Paraphoma chrysanthemicola]
MRNPTTFQSLPLELRDEIYEYSIADCFTHQDQGQFAMNTLCRGLPPCLSLNRQIREEAAKVFLRRIRRNVANIKIADPGELLGILPANESLQKVRRIEFTKAQSRYAPVHKHHKTGNLQTIQDLASRCPNLTDLTIPVRKITLTPYRTASSLDAATQFSQIHLLPNLRKLSIKGADSHAEDVKVFKVLEKVLTRSNEPAWIREKSETVKCEVDIDITPTLLYVPSHECTRGQEGCIRYLYWQDWFG